jgi:adenylate cyclase
MGADVLRTAEEHNAAINYRAALIAETTLSSIKNNVSMLSYGLNQPEPETVDFFFEENPSIAAVLFGEHEEQSFINEQFFRDHGIATSLINTYLQQTDLGKKEYMEPVIRNAAPFFEGLPILAMRFSSDHGWAAVFFSSQRLTENFGSGENSSILLNIRGDVLAHVDQDVIRQEVNLLNLLNISPKPALQEFADSGKLALQTRHTDANGNTYLAAIRRITGTGIADQMANVGSDTLVLTIIPEASVFENINAVMRLNLFLSLAVCFVTVIFMRFFSKTISGPLQLLTNAVQDVANGDYHMNIHNSRRDETGVLTKSIDSMVRMLANVEAFTNQKIAQRFRTGSLNAEGTQKEATVFFSNLRSFTEYTDNPEETVALLNDYLERMAACITLTGGTVDTCIGSTIMAHWGVVDSAGNPEQDAVNAVCTALMMRAALRSLNDARGKPVVQISCGLNSGSITAAQIGYSDRLEYTIMGTPVTLADRVRAFSEPFGTEIVITKSTQDLIKDTFIIEELSPIIEKDKKIRLFTVINVRKFGVLDRIFTALEQAPKTNLNTSRLCLGPGGPQNITELRKMLGLSASRYATSLRRDIDPTGRYRAPGERVD